MSYILDALRKSEAERQQQQAAGFADLPGQRRKRGLPLWAWLIGLLLLINAIVGAAYLVRADKPLPGAAASSTVSLPSHEAPAKPAASFSDIVREARTTVPDRPPQADPADREADPAAASSAVQQQPAAATAPAARSGGRSGTLPTFIEMRLAGELQLPDLHLDIHVYSASAAERFVFVNMNKYRENAQLSEGPRVREITADGVVLEYRGKTFLLRRE